MAEAGPVNAPAAPAASTAAVAPSVAIYVTPGDGSVAGHAADSGNAAGLLGVIVWPLLLVVLALVFRRQLQGIFTYVASNLKSISVAGVSIELAERSAPPIVQAGDAAVDIRRAGSENSVNDSTLRSFYEQIRTTSPLELAVVDLGLGREWLTSRLFILSVILRRMRGLKAVVFVDDANGLHGHFVGICSSAVLRWRLAGEYPKYEEALASGEARATPLRGQAPSPKQEPPLVDDDEGRFANRDAAAELLRGFLKGVQAPVVPAAADAAAWQALEPSPPDPPIVEYAKWVDTALIEKLLSGVLDVDAVPASQFLFADRGVRARIVFEHGSPWVPLVRPDGRFHGWIDRMAVVESLAAQAVGK